MGGLLWISKKSQSYKWGATLDLVKFEISGSRGYFGLGGGLLWMGATLDRSSLTVQTVCLKSLSPLLYYLNHVVKIIYTSTYSSLSASRLSRTFARNFGPINDISLLPTVGKY